MPTLAAAYLALYVTLCLWSYIEDFRSPRPRAPTLLVECGGDIALLIAALSYWQPELRELPLLGLLYVGGCASLAVQALRAGRESASDPELSVQGRRFVLLSGSLLVVVIAAPLLYWGGHALFGAWDAEDLVLVSS